MKSLALLIPLLLAACGHSGSDSREISRSYLSSYVYTNKVRKTPQRAFFNGHPSAEIRAVYELRCPGSAKPTRHTTLVKAYENIDISPADCELKIIETDFTDPFHIHH